MSWVSPDVWRDYEVWQAYRGGIIMGVDRANQRLLVRFS